MYERDPFDGGDPKYEQPLYYNLELGGGNYYREL